MKFIISTLLLVLIYSYSLLGQLKFESKIDYQFNPFTLEDGTLKFLKFNKRTQELLILDTDNTIWKSVTLDIPKNLQLDRIMHISQYVLDTDSLIEIIYTCVEYVDNFNTEDPEVDYFSDKYTLSIIKENGVNLLTVRDGKDIQFVNNMSGKQLLIYKDSGPERDENLEALVYSF